MSPQNRTTRRSFLKGACAALAAPLVVKSSVRGEGARLSANERITLGCIGVGGRGRSNMGDFLQRPEVQALAVCDVYRSRADGAKNIVDNKDCKAYQDFRELLAREDIDAVSIAAPDHWHAIIGIQACRSGKDVFCEKPLTLTIKEGRAMVEAARKNNRVFSSGSQRVLDDYGSRARAVRSGAAGEIREVFVDVGGPSRLCFYPGQPIPGDLDWEMWLGPAPFAPYHPWRCGGAYELGGKGWRTWFDYSGGMMTDWGGHKFGGALFALGLETAGPVEVIPPDGKEHKWLTYRFANGLNMYHAPNSGKDITFVGTEGQVPGKNPEKPVDMPVYKGQGGIIGDFLHCVRTREKPFRDVEIAHRTATVCHLGNIVYHLDRRIKWNPETEEIVDDFEASCWLDRPRRDPWTL
jgi:hypothetical protein